MLSDAVEPNLDDSASASSDPASSGTTVSSGGDTTETNSADPTIAGYAASDGPTTDDTLGFKPYVEAIASFLTAANTKPPITISIEGEWGSGKSSFLLQLEKAILEISPKDAAKPLTVRFNAWRHDKHDQLWAAFDLAFIETLRKKIGFWPALWGDCKLFVKRLDKPQAWLQLLVLVICAPIALALLWRYLSQLSVHAVADLLKSLATPPPKEPHLDTGLLDRVAVHGKLGTLLAVSIAGIWKFHQSFKLPLSLDLKKYLADPGYEGHTAFVETFHKDLKRLIESYAGQSRVYVFIDDLDRCDVPRAAELMQAINLMIGDTGNLVFILGMDREKVAAGVALKYKDLLPFMRESALWKPGADKNDFTPLYFGYAYLEKFIQLSFTLPTPNSGDTLNRFLAPPKRALRVVGHEFSGPDWLTLLFTPRYAHAERLRASIKANANRKTPDHQATQFDRSQSIQYHRVSTAEDDDQTRDIIRMTAPLFDYNPRRIKQFTNTFRLALYLSSDLGLFDVLADATSIDLTRPTPEQLGKFIALLLRFPDLRFALEQDAKLLGTLEKEALIRKGFAPAEPSMVYAKGNPVPHDTAHYRWFDYPGTTDLLTFKLGPGDSLMDLATYSLTSFDIAGLFTILPKAPPPPKTQPKPLQPGPSQPSKPASSVYDQLTALAVKYEEIRGSETSSKDRTMRLDAIFEQAQEVARLGFTPETAPTGTLFVNSPQGAGSRIIFLAVASVFVDLRNADLLLDFLQKPKSDFEQYHCLNTWLKYIEPLSGRAPEVLAALERNWAKIPRDSARDWVARELRSAAEAAISQTGTSPTSGNPSEQGNS